MKNNEIKSRLDLIKIGISKLRIASYQQERNELTHIIKENIKQLENELINNIIINNKT